MPTSSARHDQKVDWTRPAREVDCHIRGLSPFPGAWCNWLQPGDAISHTPETAFRGRSGQETSAPAGMVLDDNLLVACGDGWTVRITRLQKPGGKPLDRPLPEWPAHSSGHDAVLGPQCRRKPAIVLYLQRFAFRVNELLGAVAECRSIC
jgi:hypothetical protein